MNERGVDNCRTLARRQVIPAELDRVFPFFQSPANLALITPPSLGFRVITPPPIAMKQGQVIDYTIRLAGLPMAWRSLISTYEPPFCFVDEQLKGPYARWRHTHMFEACAEGTIVSDEVVYALPASLPPLAERVVHAAYVRPNLEKIFDYRAKFFADFFAGRDMQWRAGLATVQAAREIEL